MALRNFIFNEGTTDNPVVLSQKHIAALVAVAQDDNVEKDVKGYATMVQGDTIKRYQKYILDNKFPNLNLVNVLVSADVFRLAKTSGNNAIKEGGSSKIIATGIDMGLLDWEITHNITVSGAIAVDRSVIESRFHFNSKTGDITIDNAQENASWTDVIVLRAYPNYDHDNWQEISITVTAVEVADAALTFDSTLVGKGAMVTYAVNVYPITHTKIVRVEATSNGAGTLDTNLQRYIAPLTNETATITAKFYVGNAFITQQETEIQTADPYIKINMIDDFGAEVISDELTVNIYDSASRLIAEGLKNGEQCDVNIGEIYTIELTRPNGNENYDTAIYNNTIIPSSLINNVDIIYPAKKFGIVAVFADKSTILYSQWVYINKPRFHPMTNSPIIGVGYLGTIPNYNWLYTGTIVTMNACSGYPSMNNADYTDDDGVVQPVFEPVGSASITLLLDSYETIKYNQALCNGLAKQSQDASTSGFINIANKQSPIDTSYKKGWIPSARIVGIMIDNRTAIDDIIKNGVQLNTTFALAMYNVPEVCKRFYGGSYEFRVCQYGKTSASANLSFENIGPIGSMNATKFICLFTLD